MKRSDKPRTSHRGSQQGPRISAATWLMSATLIGGFWLILGAFPAFADGGPHVASVNNGSLGINADSCAGCHRAHTAQGPFLLNAADEDALCLTCHGATGAGATTDVASGLQYDLAGRGTTPLLGALRSGGFVTAAIDSGNPARWLRSNLLSESDNQWAKVQVRTDGAGNVDPAPVTSAHLNLADNGLAGPAVAWGNAAAGWDTGDGLLGPGPTVTLGCATCHNPHGNGQYRILNPIPNPPATIGTFTPDATGRLVKDSPTDNPDPTESDTKNYTVIQMRGTPGELSTYLLYADDVPAGYAPTAGDYWHVRVPWNAPSNNTSPLNGNDAPNGIPSTAGGQISFDVQITNWCSACHTRYPSADAAEPSVDALFTFRHETSGNRACTTCHVAHGSNARMEGTFSATQPFPNGDVPAYDINGATGDSRLLKVDGRGTCQMCHDPTYTAYPSNPYSGPLPTPGVP